MINFDYIGDNNRIPLVQIEINNSMAVTGTPPQRQAAPERSEGFLFPVLRERSHRVGIADQASRRRFNKNGCHLLFL